MSFYGTKRTLTPEQKAKLEEERRIKREARAKKAADRESRAVYAQCVDLPKCV
jgi:hypothetical protein